ncbi:MAG: DUF1080 domain-containing protein [Vicinamibacterales bacterium]
MTLGRRTLALLALVSITVISRELVAGPQAGPPATQSTGSTPQAGGAVQGRGGRGGGGLYPQTEPDDVAGFVPIFDGRTLDGWDGDPRFWRVADGVIVGESTPDRVVTLNNFLIWRGGMVRDFELKVDFRLNGANSGVQYRSIEVPSIGKWVLKGYQADIDFSAGFVGNVHEERGRSPAGEGHVVLSRRGEMTRVTDGPHYKAVARIADPTLLRGVMNINGWNQFHIIARGPVLMQIMNGQLMAVAIDEDAKHAPTEGLLGFQMHTGPPFKVEYRNVMLRKI